MPAALGVREPRAAWAEALQGELPQQERPEWQPVRAEQLEQPQPQEARPAGGHHPRQTAAADVRAEHPTEHPVEKLGPQPGRRAHF